DRLKHLEVEVVLFDRDRVLLQQPAVLGDHSRRWIELGRHRIGSADTLPETGDAEQVITHGATALAEVIEDSCLDLLRCIGWEQWPHPNGELVFPPEAPGELLILQVTGVNHAGESQAVRMRVEVRGAAQLVVRRLCALKSRERRGRA